MTSRNIAEVSEQYRNAVQTCRDVFAAAGRQFVEPKGVTDLLKQARELYAGGDEPKAVKEVQHATEWLIGVIVKFLRGGVEFFEGRIAELSYMSLDQDIMDNLRARLKDYSAAIMEEQGPFFDQRLAAYCKLAAAVTGARDEQFRRIERREQLAAEEASRKELERRERRRQQEEQDRLQALERQREAEAAARAEREKQFDQLFA